MCVIYFNQYMRLLVFFYFENASYPYILKEINLAISDKAECLSVLLTEWEII